MDDKVNIQLSLLAALIEQFKERLNRHDQDVNSMFYGDFDGGYKLALVQVIQELEERMIKLSDESITKEDQEVEYLRDKKRCGWE